MDEPTREELLAAAKALAAMVYDEWPGTLAEAVSTWGSATPGEQAAVAKLEAYWQTMR